VGIFDLPNTDDSFWHGFDFAPSDLGSSMSGPFGYQALASNDALLHYFGPISTQAQAQNLRFETPFSVAWYYRFDPQKVTISDLDTMISGLNTVQLTISNSFTMNAATSNLQHLQVNIPSDMLQNYHDQLPVAQVPIASLLVLVFALVIFFISMMANILVDRQSEAIAILRSRGADRRQIFGALVTQSSAIAVIAFLIGPLLAMGVVTLLSSLLLGSNSQGAGVLDLLAHDPRGMILTLLTYALMTTIFVLLAMLISLSLATRMDVLAMRRQAARATHKPLWQRLNLDVVAVIVSLTCYGLSLYLTRSGILDPQLRLRLLTPVTLTGLVLLLLACILLFLRIFPMLLSLGSRLASRSRNASPMLALGQMARSPRQSLRMTLLLALATAFTIFTLIFIASQSQRIESVSAYQVGADFSGAPDATSPTWQDFGQIAQSYSQMRGVLATSVGYFGTSVSSSATQSVDIEVRAPDADTFALAGSWSSQDSSQSLASLMALLRAQRASGISHKVIPAIVDDATWNLLNLSDGAHFVLGRTLGDTPVDFQVVGRVPHIPTVSDVSSDGSSAGGILVDYQTYAPVFTNDASRIGDSADVNYAWIKTTDNPILLSRLRRDLTNNFQANELLDRRILAQSLRNEPIYLDLVGILAVGAITALLLALLGNLVASWLSAKTRLTNFAVLRALGAAPGQISSVLIWEQGIIYLTALVLGVLFGALLAALAVPTLVYTNAAPTGMTSDPSNSVFFVSQSIPAIEVVVPLSLWIVLGVLIVICVLALWMMVRIVSRPSVSQTLRLNED
jgi:ABC-type antimicrobial peptide transport system permease subunit